MVIIAKTYKMFYISLLIVNICKLYSNEIYRIPIGLYNWNKEQKSKDFIQNIFHNILYVNLTIGNPPQTIPFQLNANSQAFYASNKYFNPNESSTYELLSDKEIFYSYEFGTYGYQSKDVLKINNIERKIDIIYETKTEKQNNLSNIGLLIPNRIQTGIYPFFTSLKNAGIINSYTWTFKFFSNTTLFDTIYKKDNIIIGEFIIGDEPHNYEPDKKLYDVTEYMKSRPEHEEGTIFWNINFDSIYIIKKDNENNNNSKIKIYGKYLARIDPDIGFIICPNEFYSTITDTFFNKYYDICIDKYLDDSNKLRYIECEKNDSFNISSFPDLYFEHKEFETIFNFTYKDLFILDETNNKYIFLIINNKYSSIWTFGKIFLKKYQLTFNVDSKSFGYYKSMNNYNKDNKNADNNSKSNENKNENHTLIMIMIIVLFVILCSLLSVVLGMYIQKTCSKRKKRINELEDVNNDYDDIEKIMA